MQLLEAFVPVCWWYWHKRVMFPQSSLMFINIIQSQDWTFVHVLVTISSLGITDSKGKTSLIIFVWSHIYDGDKMSFLNTSFKHHNPSDSLRQLCQPQISIQISILLWCIWNLSKLRFKAKSWQWFSREQMNGNKPRPLTDTIKQQILGRVKSR